MYGKIFDTMYDGTLRADWKAMITLQQLIVLADQDGTVDMTIFSLHGRTGIPLDILEYGIDYLSKPDPYSRSSVLEGRRIRLLEDDRNWGWEIVNYKHYRDLATREDKRQKDRVRIAKKRSTARESQGVAGSRITSEEVEKVAHTDVDVDVDVNTNNKPLSASSDAGQEDFYLTKKKRKLSGEQLTSFLQFWEAFSYKRGKAEAADAWINLKVTRKLLPEIIKGAEAEAKNRSTIISKKLTPGMAEGWLSGRRWEDESISPSSPDYKDPKIFIITDEWIRRGESVSLKPEEGEKAGDFKMRVLDAESVARAMAEL